jgi:NADH:ubiquinone reductase (H+-translocating)
MMHRVVIIGGGFAGLYAAKALKNAPVDVTLVDRRNFHLFQPLLYQVATGQLSPGDIAAPLRAVFKDQKNVRVLLGEVSDILPEQHLVELSDGERIPFDSLIVAAGARNFFFGHDEWKHAAPGLKTIEDATQIRHKILFAFEAAERETDPDKRRAWLTFLVVGGGPTGVELAGAIGEIANDVMHGEFRSIDPNDARILLVEGGPRILSTFAPELSFAAEKSLIDLGVRTRVNVRVTEIDMDGAYISTPHGDDFIPAKTVLWGAGVRTARLAEILRERTGAELDRGGRVIVDPDCTIPGYPTIFVAGDLAHVKDGETGTVPGVAPAAMQMGRYAAKTIVRRLNNEHVEPFRYFDKGSLAVIGRAAGVAQFGDFHFSGLLAWLLWLFVHLMYIVGFQNRIIVFIRWGFSYFTYNRGARLITGRDAARIREEETVSHQ